MTTTKSSNISKRWWHHQCLSMPDLNVKANLRQIFKYTSAYYRNRKTLVHVVGKISLTQLKCRCIHDERTRVLGHILHMKLSLSTRRTDFAKQHQKSKYPPQCKEFKAKHTFKNQRTKRQLNTKKSCTWKGLKVNITSRAKVKSKAEHLRDVKNVRCFQNADSHSAF